MTFPSEHDFFLFLFQLFVLLSAALGLGGFFRKLGQPPVVGEILAGVLLGPSVFANLFPNLSDAFFPPSQTHMLGTLAWLGSIFLLLVAGTEVEPATLRREGRVVVSTSLMGIAFPFVVGVLFALYIPDNYLVDPDQRRLFALFMGVAMSISAIPVVAKILIDLNLIHTPTGHVILGAAVIDDLIGWTLFAILLSFISGEVVGNAIFSIILMTSGLVLFCFTIGKFVMSRLFSFVRFLGFPPEGTIGLAVLSSFFFSALTQWIGIHAVFGAYLTGVMIGQTGEFKNHTRETLRNLVLYVLAPIFFATMGLRANFVTNFDLVLVAGVLSIACFVKIFGCTLGALLGGMEWSKALAVGFGLNARGAMEIILAFLALEYGLINEKVFVALVITAVATSILSGPCIKWAISGKLHLEKEIAPAKP